MVILIIIIIIIVSLFLLLFGYMFVGMSTGMALHTIYFLHKNSKRTLQYMLDEGVTIKSNGIDFHWIKTDFGDYKTRWVLLNQSSRKKVNFDIIMDISGNIVRIDEYEERYIKEYLRKGVDLSKFFPK